MKKKANGRAALILRFLRGSKAYFLLCLAFAIGMSLFEMINPKIISYTVDSVIGNQPSNLPGWVLDWIERLGGAEFLRGHLWVIALTIAGAAVLAVTCRYFYRLFNAKGAETLVQTMRNDIYRHIESLPYSWHMQNNTGDIIQRSTSDVDMVKRFLSEQLTNLIRIAALTAMALTFMYGMNAPLAAAATVTLPITILYSAFFHRRISKRFQECDENEGLLSTMAQENLTGVRVVRAFGRERYENERFEAQNRKYANLWIRLGRTLATFWSVSDFISGAQIMLIITLGAVSSVNGHMTAGEFIAFVSYNAMLAWPMRQLGRMISEMSQAGIALGRIKYIMDSPSEQDAPDATEPDLHGDISFEHVSFGYGGAEPLLHDISFTIKSGTTFGILGGTGSGKSTLMYLLTRLYELPPENGRITVGGVDIAGMRAEHLRRNIGIVLQEPFLFSRSIKENIGITRADASFDDIRRASGVACVRESIEGFENGFDTFVGERGVTLSGGQKQRTAIARMLLQSSPIMVFDDSLSAVDSETDAKIRAQLSRNMGDATVVLISHRVLTLMQAEQILVLDHGRIAELGTHRELMELGGIYRRIYDMQTSGRIEEATDE